MKPLSKPRIAVLGLSLGLYRQTMPGYMERLQKQLERFEAEIRTLADIASTQLCWAQEQVERTIRDAEAADLDCLLLIPMCYTASLMTLLSVVKTPLPVVIWNTQEALEISDGFTGDDLTMNHVTQGTQDVTNVLLRTGRVFGMESGHYRDRAALQKLGDWLSAARTARRVRELRVGLLGSAFQDMGDFAVDETLMASTWGPYTVHLAVADFVKRIAAVDQAAVDRIVREDGTRFEVAREVSRDIHELSVRLELALRSLVVEHRLDAFTMNFLDLMQDGRCPTMPFLGINKLMAEGMGYAGEGNALIAAHMAQMRLLCEIANFTEIYTIDYVSNRMLMTHMQECNPALARGDRKVKLIRRDFWAPGVERYVGMHFTLEPGPVTLTTMIPDAKNRFTYIAYETRIRDMEPLEKFDQPHWMTELSEPVGEFLTRYSMAGGPHHLVAVPGHRAGALEKLAHFQGFGMKRI